MEIQEAIVEFTGNNSLTPSFLVNTGDSTIFLLLALCMFIFTLVFIYIKKKSLFKFIVLPLSAVIAFAGILVFNYTASAEDTNIIKASVSEDGSITIPSYELNNNEDIYKNLIYIETDSLSQEQSTWTISTQDNQLYKNKAGNKQEIDPSIIIKSKNILEINISTDMDKQTAKSLIDKQVIKIKYGLTINKPVKSPDVKTNLVYNNQEQCPIENTDGLILEGTYKAINAGNYNFTITPNEGYCWEDGSKDTKEISWSINKAQATVKVDDVSLLKDQTKEFDIDYTGDSTEINISCEDESIAKLTVVNSKLNVQALAVGSTTGTIKYAEGQNYTACECSFSITVLAYHEHLKEYTLSEIKAVGESLSEGFKSDEENSSPYFEQFSNFCKKGVVYSDKTSEIAQDNATPEIEPSEQFDNIEHWAIDENGLTYSEQNFGGGWNKEIQQYNSEQIIEARIIGICQDDKADGNGKAGLTLMTTHSLQNTKEFFPYYVQEVTDGGWASTKCIMRTYLNDGNCPDIPQSLFSQLTTVKKASSTTWDGPNVAYSNDKIFVPATHEVSNMEKHEQYEYPYVQEGPYYKIFQIYNQTEDSYGLLMHCHGYQNGDFRERQPLNRHEFAQRTLMTQHHDPKYIASINGNNGNPIQEINCNEGETLIVPCFCF